MFQLPLPYRADKLSEEEFQEFLQHPDDIGEYHFESRLHFPAYVILDPANNEMDPADVVRLLNERKTS